MKRRFQPPPPPNLKLAYIAVIIAIFMSVGVLLWHKCAG